MSGSYIMPIGSSKSHDLQIIVKLLLYPQYIAIAST